MTRERKERLEALGVFAVALGAVLVVVAAALISPALAFLVGGVLVAAGGATAAWLANVAPAAPVPDDEDDPLREAREQRRVAAIRGRSVR